MPYFTGKDDTRLFYSDWGTGDPIVFCASQAISSDLWSSMIADFNDRGFRCIAFDRRGHGRSDQPGRGYDMDTLASDIAALVDKLGLDRVTLIGHSLGGAEIVRYIGRYGSRKIRRVVLLAATTPFMTKTADHPHGVEPTETEALLASWRVDFPKWVDDNVLPFFARPVSPALASWTADLLLRTNLRVILECAKATMYTDLRRDLRSFTVPTLVLHGTLDASVPVAFAQLTADLIPGCSLEIIEGAAHGLFLTDRDRVNDSIARFLASE